MQLHPLPSDGRFYCGPSAIAAFTGLHPKREVREMVNKVRGRKPNAGVVLMQDFEVAAVLGHFGFSGHTDMTAMGQTLKAFVKENPDFVGVLYVTGHFVAVSRGMCLDNHTRIARPVDVFPGNRKVIKSTIALEKR